MRRLLKMKLNNDFLIHNTGNGEMLIPVGEETKKFHGVIKLTHFYEEYPDEDKEVIKKSVSDFVNKLKEVNAITN